MTLLVAVDPKQFEETLKKEALTTANEILQEQLQPLAAAQRRIDRRNRRWVVGLQLTRLTRFNRNAVLPEVWTYIDRYIKKLQDEYLSLQGDEAA